MHILRSFLTIPASACALPTRVYVDDITITATGTTAREVVRKLAKELPQLKAHLHNKLIVTNDAKEQFYSPTREVIKLWTSTQRRYKGTVVTCAKDLGVAQRALSCSSKVRKRRLEDAKRKAGRIKSLRTSKAPKAQVTRASLQAGCL